ncbi:MAG: glycosyltransferase family 2 protein, partial [Alteromonadaceae bacterium]|nr:glycosyltransferase family 2 protein [Alteromonadaceae bacterium]
ENFNRSFVSDGFTPIHLSGDAPDPFDRIESKTPDVGESTIDTKSPLVSVVFTTFRPTRYELMTSVRSILNQTVTNIEVLIVDDASGPEFTGLLDEIEKLDSRVEVIRLNKNGGTYVARNIGFERANGKYVTGQDDDDWSHPQRLETQVRHLKEHRDSVGCRISAVFCLPNLSRTRLGYRPANSNASSLMVPKEVMHESGGFLPIRKAADTELARRIERIFEKKIDDLSYRLSIVRVEPDSLSRSEFGAGWSHPARNQFKSSYSYWQKTATAHE